MRNGDAPKLYFFYLHDVILILKRYIIALAYWQRQNPLNSASVYKGYWLVPKLLLTIILSKKLLIVNSNDCKWICKAAKDTLTNAISFFLRQIIIVIVKLNLLHQELITSDF